MTRPSRRDFVKTAALSSAAPLGLGQVFHHRVDDKLRVGLVGCGGRGTGAAVQALKADDNVELVAMGDVFADKLQSSLDNLLGAGAIANKVDVPEERRFVGFDAYEKVMEQDIDVVLLATPPHFRPAHLRHAIERGLHVFAEKPVAVDAPGVRSVLETCRLADKKKLSVVSGLCYRYHDGRRALLEQIHEGRIGDVVSLQANYITGALWSHPRQEGWSDLEYQMRNWLYYTWLSGDHIAEQHIHSLDVIAWAMEDRYPVRAVSLGGRQVRTEPIFGHVYDHFATIYTWDDDVTGHSYCRQQQHCYREVNDYVVGTKGRANVFKHRIDGENPWRFEGKAGNMYQNEHDALFRSIRQGSPINNGDYMCKSTLMAIMGRMAAYTGKAITWEEALQSQEDLTPAQYDWGPMPAPDVALPGLTAFR